MQYLNLFDWQFWAYALLFFLGLFSLFSLGFGIISKLKMKANSEVLTFLFSNVLGVGLFTVGAYILGYLKLRSLLYLFPAFGVFLFVYKRVEILDLLKSLWIDLTKMNRIAFYLSIVGIIAQVIIISSSGLMTSEGIKFHRLNGIDGVLHLAFSEFMKLDFPPPQPGAAGLSITNYHYFSNLLISEFSRIFGIPVINVYFHFLPLVIAVLIAIAVYQLVKKLGGSQLVINWALFIHFFAGNAAHFFAYIFRKEFIFYTPAIDHGLLQFLNVPQSLARLFFLTGFISLLMWLEKRKFKWGLITVFLFATLFGFKVYFGIFAVLGFSLLSFYLLLESLIKVVRRQNQKRTKLSKLGLKLLISWFKKNKDIFLLLLIFAILVAIFFFPTNKSSGGLIYVPLMWVKILIADHNIGWQDWWLRMQVYELYENKRAIFVYNSLAVGVFLLSSYATRLFGMIIPIQIFKKYKGKMALFAWVPALLFTFLGMNTLQESGGANVFNFFVVALMIFGIFTAFWLEKILKFNKIFGVIFAVIFVVISIIRPAQDLYLFLKSIAIDEETTLISSDSLEAFDFVKSNTSEDSVIQLHPDDRLNWETPYGSYFTLRRSFLGGQGILESHNQPIQERVEIVKSIFSTSSASRFLSEIKNTPIDYLILRKNKNERIGVELPVFFENETMIVYEINK